MAARYPEDLECKHYSRKCSLFTPCCKNVYACRFCHDKNEKHQLDRKTVQEIVCNYCDFKQKVNIRCTKCGTYFGRYTCLECRLFDDNDKQQFHCAKCGICRVGGRHNYRHCEKCGICVNQFSHSDCIQDGAKTECPICLDDLHSSTKPITMLPCMHYIHEGCKTELVQFKDKTCPLCRKQFV